MPPKKKEISVVDRRLQSGSIFGTSSRPIPLTEPNRWELRIVNSQISANRLYEMQADRGWVYAVPEDLAVKPEEIGFQILDGRIVRGERGQEVVMKMERADYREIQKMKDTENRKNTFGKEAVKSAILAAAAKKPDGGRGADFLSRHDINVTDSREVVTLEE